ncbi:MAG: hypothetical protein SWE60_08880 [Thermodesulfobacteriota bacterium]|nr:hypothetical protein [Thermodesulfobacteriota bacterium]
MKIVPIIRLPVALVALACLASCQIAYQKIHERDLPKTLFETTVYRSGTGAPAVILDDPNDQVLLSPRKDVSQFKKKGLNKPEEFLDYRGWRPEIYRLQHRETKNVWGYLLLSPELNWLVQYNEKRSAVRVWIEDPHTLAGP